MRFRLCALFVALVFVSTLAAGCRPKPSPGPAAWPSDEWFDRLAQCETGGNWGAPGPTYVGGLGLWHGNWGDNGGYEFAPSANLASREQQIIVGRRIALRYGPNAWGCTKAIGVP